MGCTSSTPNMVNSSTTEKSIHFEDEMSDIDSLSKNNAELCYTAANESSTSTKHPSCNTLTEHDIHVVRNQSTPSFKTEKDDQEDRQFSVISHKQTVSNDTIHEGEKVPKLEEVVKKVVGLHTSEKNQPQPVLKIAEESQNRQECNDKNNLEEIDDAADTEEPIEVEHDEPKECHPEAISPSQSESSRATRWEALADIAAELPPTLTVDPITGQIYSLSK